MAQTTLYHSSERESFTVHLTCTMEFLTMKTKQNLLIVVACAVALSPSFALAQIAVNDAPQAIYYTHTPVSASMPPPSQVSSLMDWVDSDDFGIGDGTMALGRRTMFPFWEEGTIALQTNLNQNQKDQLAQSYRATRTEFDKAQVDYRTAMSALREELGKDNPSPTEVSKFSDQIADASKVQQKAILNHAAFIKNTLTTEQEHALVRAGEDYTRQIGLDLQTLRQSIATSMQQGGGYKEAQAIIDGSTLPESLRNRVRDEVASRIERTKTWNEQGYGGTTSAPRYAAPRLYGSAASPVPTPVPDAGGYGPNGYGVAPGYYSQSYQEFQGDNDGNFYGVFPNSGNPAYHFWTYRGNYPGYSISPENSDGRGLLDYNGGGVRGTVDRDRDGEARVDHHPGAERSADGPNTTISGNPKNSRGNSKGFNPTATPVKRDTPGVKTDRHPR